VSGWKRIKTEEYKKIHFLCDEKYVENITEIKENTICTQGS